MATARLAVEEIGRQACAEGVYLVPLRLFIGLGWLRACLEKAIDPAWYDGTGVAGFLREQAAHRAVPFPFYEDLIRLVLLPHAALLGWVIVIGELLAGAAIAAGCCTRAALWGGLFMNLNFLLAGVPNPSAFYIVIQVTLLLANAGTILGVDGMRREGAASRAVVRRWRHWATAILALATAAYAAAHVTDTSPAGSVRDPAMILAILATMVMLWSLLALIRPNPSTGA